ncbi:MerR family transcriptional regulator [Acrocarpospora phusangensis]|uniref:MerR family transcriptional regulator n=1 Tax=Acrocarpospora phusangensis TaxID=1070424 RepID=A0A919UK11_9ACTN|nr:MerR family transcriptional regulator [Acrocarpospora phusangensis]GIH24466.1 MerR family transcriptional regulator [Acrocarpospora phusangensis]
MDPVPIGEAARLLKINTSALRYYEEIGLVRPAARVGGRRTYGRAELRRLAFVQMAQELGFSLEVIAEVLDQPGGRWHEAIDAQIARLEVLIEQARRAQDFLVHARECTTANPVQECTTLAHVLDRRVDGLTLDEIAKEHHP